MIVIDAGVVIELVAGGLDPQKLGVDELAAPHLIDSEVTNVLRRLVARGHLSAEEGGRALEGFMGMTLRRYPADGLRLRMWELRHNLSAYDATYVALAEQIGATELLTTDARLASTPGIRCAVTVL
ncbi:type II toxin-antitoxin system VapC family toxin [Arthrobacter sp. H5]|uniref:type II toxin-antitoxin system VapC family toxin n=1 Tax=Arthrobacter sp. H5 TaxID=1267973 RepID=UPI0004829987|nr:type II toxin-antitoxin system VapC family toxin [Arthrobacter sp. H5]